MRTIPWFFLILVGCGGGDSSSIGPGDQSYTPPPMQQGSGMPSDATSVTCTAASDCDYWYCRCDDGAVVNSALCVNGYCMGAASACPNACAYFQHGGWTGDAGGGPGHTTSTCGGLGSHIQACDSCMHESCCDEATACGQESTCLSYWDCVIPCGSDAGCRADCDALYPAGKAPYQGLEGCLVDHCLDACAGAGA